MTNVRFLRNLCFFYHIVLLYDIQTKLTCDFIWAKSAIIIYLYREQKRQYNTTLRTFCAFAHPALLRPTYKETFNFLFLYNTLAFRFVYTELFVFIFFCFKDIMCFIADGLMKRKNFSYLVLLNRVVFIIQKSEIKPKQAYPA